MNLARPLKKGADEPATATATATAAAAATVATKPRNKRAP